MVKIAVIETGGKQYVVENGSVLNVDPVKSLRDHGAGKIVFDKILLVDDGKTTTVGTPYIADAKVSAELVSEGRSKKVTVIRYRQKSRYFKKRGHRQQYLKVSITNLP